MAHSIHQTRHYFTTNDLKGVLMMRLIIIFMALLGMLQTATAGNIVIKDPTIKMAKKGMSTGAFMVIENTGGKADTLLSAHSDIAVRTEVHLSSISKDGMAKMEHQKNGVVIPAGEKLILKHGSYHIMFMKLTTDVKHHSVPFKLVFKNAGSIMVQAKVISHMMKKPHAMKHSHN